MGLRTSADRRIGGVAASATESVRALDTNRRSRQYSRSLRNAAIAVPAAQTNPTACNNVACENFQVGSGVPASAMLTGSVGSIGDSGATKTFAAPGVPAFEGAATGV